MEIQKLLNKIQQNLKAPKNQRNTFGNYNYRSCEDILEAVKPLLDGAVLTISDTVENIGNKNYVKATATLTIEGETIQNTAYAREAETKKGMDDSQITGATSSYARKYALNGLFAIDDTKDADTMDNSQATAKQEDVNPHKKRLLVKIKNHLNIKTTPTAEQIIDTISIKAGINIKTLDDLKEDIMCKQILEMWA